MWTPPPLPSPARRERPSSASTLGDAFGAIYARYKCIPADPSLPSLILARYNEHYKATFGRMRLPHYVKIENFHRMVVDAMVLFFNFERRFPHLSKGDRLGLCEALLFEARMQSDEGCAEEELCVEGEINRWWNLFPGLPPSGTPPPGTRANLSVLQCGKPLAALEEHEDHFRAYSARTSIPGPRRSGHSVQDDRLSTNTTSTASSGSSIYSGISTPTPRSPDMGTVGFRQKIERTRKRLYGDSKRDEVLPWEKYEHTAQEVPQVKTEIALTPEALKRELKNRGGDNAGWHLFNIGKGRV